MKQCRRRSAGSKRPAGTNSVLLFVALLFLVLPVAARGAANLFVTMSHSPAPARAETSLMIEFKIRNQGDAPSGRGLIFAATCANTVPQGPACSFARTTQNLPDLQPGEEVTVGPVRTAPWQAGSYRLTTSLSRRGAPATVKVFALVVSAVTKVAPSGVAPASPPAATPQPRTTGVKPALSEANPKAVPKPDLTLDLVLPSHAGDTLRVAVRNVGDLVSPTTWVRVTCETGCGNLQAKPCPGAWPKQQPVAPLAAGAKTMVTISDQLPPWPTGLICFNRFSALVDPGKLIEELSEGNNEKTGLVSPTGSSGG